MSTEPRKDITIRANLFRPSGDGPHPAVIVLHGCTGPHDHDRIWASRLTQWGYVAMLVDSFGPRGVIKNCRAPSQGPPRVLKRERALDAENAKNYLAGLPFVDKENIGVLGFSEGGGAVLQLASYQFSSFYKQAGPFKAAVAFYPPCRISLEVHTNLMILIGEKDDWTPAANCVNSLPYSTQENCDVILKVYPDTYHAFDFEQKDHIYLQHVLKYNQTATRDAISQTKAFFDKHLKQR